MGGLTEALFSTCECLPIELLTLQGAHSRTSAMAKTVKDVPSHEFVRNYAAHLKRSGKVPLSTNAFGGVDPVFVCFFSVT